MSKLDHNANAVADAYAKTLLELSEKQGNSDRVAEEFADFVEAMKSDAQFGEYMSSVMVDADARGKTLEKHFRGKMVDLLLSTLQVINRRGRGELVPLICERYHHWLGEHRNQVDVSVTSAVPLTEALRGKLNEAISHLTGKTSRLHEKVDASLLSGLVIRVGDDKLDTSAKRQLRNIFDRLRERASAELHGGRSHYDTAGA